MDLSLAFMFFRIKVSGLVRRNAPITLLPKPGHDKCDNGRPDPSHEPEPEAGGGGFSGANGL
jgi:hypothetical protein